MVMVETEEGEHYSETLQGAIKMPKQEGSTETPQYDTRQAKRKGEQSESY